MHRNTRTVVPLVVELPLHDVVREHLLHLLNPAEQSLCCVGKRGKSCSDFGESTVH